MQPGKSLCSGWVQPLPAHFAHTSTHAFGVAEAIELARALRQLPSSLVVYGVEGTTFEPGMCLSTAVAERVHMLELLADTADPLAQELVLDNIEVEDEIQHA